VTVDRIGGHDSAGTDLPSAAFAATLALVGYFAVPPVGPADGTRTTGASRNGVVRAPGSDTVAVESV